MLSMSKRFWSTEFFAASLFIKNSSRADYGTGGIFLSWKLFVAARAQPRSDSYQERRRRRSRNIALPLKLSFWLRKSYHARKNFSSVRRIFFEIVLHVRCTGGGDFSEFFKRHLLVEGSAAKFQFQQETVLDVAQLREVRLEKSFFYSHFNHLQLFLQLIRFRVVFVTIRPKYFSACRACGGVSREHCSRSSIKFRQSSAYSVRPNISIR